MGEMINCQENLCYNKNKIIIKKVLRILKWTKKAPMPVGAFLLIDINYLLILLIIQSRIQAPTTDTKIL